MSRHSPAPDAGAAASAGWRKLLATTESRILAVGLGLLVAITLALGIGLVLAPTTTLHYGAMMGLNLVIGWGGGVSYGIASGLGRTEVVLCNLLADSAQVLVAYPLFVLGWRELIDVPRLRPMLQRLRVAAESGHARVRRLGIVGLFVFVLVPFWMTGPLVGAIIGFLLGLRPLVNMAVVLSASGVAIALYAAFLEPLNAWASAVHPYALFVVIAGLAVLVWVARQWWKRRPPACGPGTQPSNARSSSSTSDPT